MVNSALLALKDQTAQLHARVAEQLALDACDLTPTRLLVVVSRFYGFWPGSEPIIEDWAHGEPVMSRSLRWDRRGRSAVLGADVERLGGHAAWPEGVPVAPRVFAAVATAEFEAANT